MGRERTQISPELIWEQGRGKSGEAARAWLLISDRHE